MASVNGGASSPAHWKNVFDRLADPATFTGVYAERFKSGPGINHDADVKLHQTKTSFEGSTNTASDEHIRDIRYITRPNLNRDRNDPASPFGRAAEKVRAKYEAAERALLQHLEATAGGPAVYVMPTSGTAPLSSAASAADSASVAGGAGGEGQGLGQRLDPDRPIDTNVQLQLLFQYYCRFGRTGGAGDESDTLDSFNFAKFTKECPDLVDIHNNTKSGKLTATEIDLIFVKCKHKAGRRLNYGQWLDALAAMASLKFSHVEDPAQAFAMLLTQHVFTSPASIGIAQAVRSGLIRVEPTPSSSASAGQGRHVGSSASSVGEGQGQQGVTSPAGPAGRPRTAGAAAGPFSAAAAAAGISPRNRTRNLTGFGGSVSPAAQVFAAGGAVHVSSSAAGSPSGSASITGHGHGHGYSGATPGRPMSASLLGSLGSPGAGSFSISAAAPPSDIYDVIARKALEIQLQAAAAAAAQSHHQQSMGLGSPVRVDPAAVAAAAAALGIPLPNSQSVSAGQAGRRAGGAGSPSGSASSHSPGGSPGSEAAHRRGRGVSVSGSSVMSGGPGAGPISGAVVRTSSPTFRAVAQVTHPAHPAVAGLSSVGAGAVGGGLYQVAASVFSSSSSVVGGAGQGAARSPRSPSRAGSVSPRAGLGEAGFRPTIPGEGIRPGGVYDRLSSPEGFTGVYKRAWFTDGRINAASDTGVSARPTTFEGHTNTGTNETIHDLSHALRPGVTQTDGKPAFRP